MADQIKVTFGSLDTAEADLTAGHAAMGQRLADLKADIQPMISTWEGSAQAAYYAHQQQWDSAWDELTMALADFRRATGTANADYQAGEALNTSRFA